MHNNESHQRSGWLERYHYGKKKKFEIIKEKLGILDDITFDNY